MPDYISLMRMKRTAALAVALVLGTVAVLVSLFVGAPLTSDATAAVDPIAEVDEAPPSPQE